MIGTGEGYLVELSLGIPLGPPIGYLNPGDVMHGTLLGETPGLWFGYEAVRLRCYSC